MSDCTLESTPADWIIDHPETLRVFESLGIDCSCGGRSVEYHCLREGYHPQTVLQALEDAIGSHSSARDADGKR